VHSGEGEGEGQLVGRACDGVVMPANLKRKEHLSSTTWHSSPKIYNTMTDDT
jgi:hypothetical protein